MFTVDYEKIKTIGSCAASPSTHINTHKSGFGNFAKITSATFQKSLDKGTKFVIFNINMLSMQYI